MSITTTQKTFVENCAKICDTNAAFIKRVPADVLAEMLKVKFPQNWKVEKVSAGRAVCRFMVNNRFSVFFDAVGELLLGKLMWEFYDTVEEGDVWRFPLGEEYEMVDEMQEISEGYYN